MNKVQVSPNLDEIELLKKVLANLSSRYKRETSIIYE
jgi:hypothetical protein